MSHKLINRNADLLRLREEGYDIEIKGAYLVLNDVPYVNGQCRIAKGRLIAKLNLAGDTTQKPDTHVVQFSGDHPCHADGSAMTELVIGSARAPLDDGLVADHTFSQKPQRGYYENYYEEMTTYTAILVSQARKIDASATAQTFRVEAPPEEDDSPFNYLDTASSRADINMVTKKLGLGNVAIIGLGGTGAYVFDLVTKTPVKQIHAFDGDKMSTHNAFRSPGAATIEQLREQPLKTAYFKERYAPMHKGIVTHDYYVDASNVGDLRGMDFVFVCIDKASAKAVIIAKLMEWKIPFVDVGMGVYLKNGTLGGIVRVTAATAAKADHIGGRISMSTEEPENNEYDTNIQIADLNALNAALAVIAWKKLMGFYNDLGRERFTAYTIDTNTLVNEDHA
jgi:hypothetical protein